MGRPSTKYILLAIAGGIAAFSVIINVLLMWFWTIPGTVDEPKAEYDYIIVGGGSAGCVLSRRIAEKCGCSVLLIEAGTTAPWISHIPIVAAALQLTPADWKFKTAPQQTSQWGIKDRRSLWPRGKALGGSSTINYMLHMWGSRYSFDEIFVEATGDESWNFESVLPYFQKSEYFERKSGKPVPDIRGKNGLLPVEELHGVPTKLANAFLKGASNLGLKTGDLNGEIENGAMLAQSNVKLGRRVSTFDAYLRPILGQHNISLLVNTMATKLLFNGKKAAGVEVMNLFTYKVHRIRSRKELIISAGTVGSPHLLLLSGVGPAEQLQAMSIPVVADLPGVGQNLRDHINVPLYFHLNQPLSVTTAKARSIHEVWKYFSDGEGVLSSSGVQAIARAPIPGRNSSNPGIYFMLLNIGSVNEDVFKKISGMEDKVFTQSFPETHNDSKEGFIILPSCAFPRSSGSIILASTDPLVQPIINPRYLEEKEDVKCFLKAMRMAARLGSTKPLLAFGSRLHLPAYDMCAEHEQSLENDEYLECWLRTSAITGYHPVGTCSMGRSDDPLAVLDSRFRVRGLDGLRVVDASSMPQLVAGTPHATVVMMAERAAEWILEDQ